MSVECEFFGKAHTINRKVNCESCEVQETCFYKTRERMIEEWRRQRMSAVIREASEKPIAFALRMLLQGVDGVLRCYIKNYPAEKCGKCSLKAICKGIYELRVHTRSSQRL